MILSIGNNLSLSVKIWHCLWQSFTIYYNLLSSEQPVTISNNLTICNNLSLSVTIFHYLYQSLAICNNLLLYVTISHYLKQSVTICNNLSLSITILHQTELIVKNFKILTKVWHSDTQTDTQTEWLTGPDLERHAPLKKTTQKFGEGVEKI